MLAADTSLGETEPPLLFSHTDTNTRRSGAEDRFQHFKSNVSMSGGVLQMLSAVDSAAGDWQPLLGHLISWHWPTWEPTVSPSHWKSNGAHVHRDRNHWKLNLEGLGSNLCVNWWKTEPFWWLLIGEFHSRINYFCHSSTQPVLLKINQPIWAIYNMKYEKLDGFSAVFAACWNTQC